MLRVCSPSTGRSVSEARTEAHTEGCPQIALSTSSPDCRPPAYGLVNVHVILVLCSAVLSYCSLFSHLSLTLSLSVSLSKSVSVSPSLSLSLCVSPFVCLSLCVFVCLSVCLCFSFSQVSLSVSLFFCLPPSTSLLK